MSNVQPIEYYDKELSENLKWFCEEKQKGRLKGIELHTRELDVIKSTKIGNNEKCPCGSGKKYKKCCKNNETIVVSSSIVSTKVSET